MSDPLNTRPTAGGPSVASTADDAGRQFRDLLWRPIKKGDWLAAKARAQELRGFINGLSPETARELSFRVTEDGDLHGDVNGRLTVALAQEVVEGLAKRAATVSDVPVMQRGFLSSLFTFDPGTSNRGLTAVSGVAPATTSRGLPTARSVTAPSASLTKRWEFEGRSIRLKKFTFARIYATVRGSLAVSLSTAGEHHAHHVGFISKGKGEVEVEVTEALFGATIGAGTKRTKAGARTLSLTVGTDLFDLELTADPFSPIGISLPVVSLVDIKLEERLPSLGLKGTGTLVAEIEIEIVPNYKKLADAAKAAQQSLKKGGRQFGRALAKVGGRIGRVIRSGLKQLWSLRELPGGINAARKILALSKTQGPPRIGTAAIRRLAARAMLIVEVIFILKEIADSISEEFAGAMRDGAERFVIDEYRWGYATMLDILTHSDWKDSFHAYLSPHDPFKDLWKVRPPLINLSGIGAPQLSAQQMQWFISHATLTERRKIDLVAIDLDREVPELVGVALVAFYQSVALGLARYVNRQSSYDSRLPVRDPVEDPPEIAALSARLERTLEIIKNEATVAGRASAFQDVFAFIVTMGQQGVDDEDYENGESTWNAVAELHRLVFGSDDKGSRAPAYHPLIGPDGISIFPFAE